MRLRDIIKLISSLILCQLAGFIGSLFTIPAIPTWYRTLNKPFFTPPDWIFAPVWIGLYLMMGISLYMVWRRKGHDLQVKGAFILFFIQLVLNAFWSVAFFGLKSPMAGLINIIILWIALLWTTKKFFKVSRDAAILLLPYILWVSFAAVLNFSLWALNR